MTNRVDELESKVAKLQATVDGLTEELVETKERVRLLEESVDVDLTAGSRTVGSEPGAEGDARTNAAADTGTDATADAGTETARGGGLEPLSESDAQSASRSRTSATGSEDVDFIDADSEEPVPSEADRDGTAAGGDDRAAGGDGTKTGGDESNDEATTDDDDIIVA